MRGSSNSLDGSNGQADARLAPRPEAALQDARDEPDAGRCWLAPLAVALAELLVFVRERRSNAVAPPAIPATNAINSKRGSDIGLSQSAQSSLYHPSTLAKPNDKSGRIPLLGDFEARMRRLGAANGGGWSRSRAGLILLPCLSWPIDRSPHPGDTACRHGATPLACRSRKRTNVSAKVVRSP